MSTQETKLKAIADAIRTKSGETGTIQASQFAEKILNLPVGETASSTIPVPATASTQAEFFLQIANAIRVKEGSTAEIVANDFADRILALQNISVTISIVVSPAGSATVTGAGTYNIGDLVTLSIELTEGYVFDGWEEKGVIVTDETTLIFTASENRIFKAISSVIQSVLVWYNIENFPSSTSYFINSVTYGNGMFFGVGYGKKAWYSYDAFSWNEFSFSYQRSLSVSRICYGDNKFVAVCDGVDTAVTSDVCVIIEKNQTELYASYSNLPSSQYWRCVLYGNGRFVTICDEGLAAYSDDGINWYLSEQNVNTFCVGCYGNGKFVVVGARKIFISENGETWSSFEVFVASTITSICYGGGKFVGLNYNEKKVIYSEDGINWSESEIPVSFNINSKICYGNGKYVIIGYNSNVSIYSSDLITWNVSFLPASTYWNDIVYGDNVFLSISNRGYAACNKQSELS